MKIPENRIYPYPMFSNKHNDYKDNVFDVDFSYQYDYNSVWFTTQININNKFIIDMLKNEKFKLVLHLDCTKTKFRKTYPILYENINKEHHFSINSENLIGETEAMFLLVSSEDIVVTNNSAFDSFYENDSVEFPQFAIVGFSDAFNLTFHKKLGLNQQPSSIFNITKAQVEHKKYNLENDTIAILLPEKEYSGYIKLQGVLQRTKHAMFVEAALTYTLDKIKQDQDGFYSQKEWYKALEASCTKQGIEFETEKFKETESYEIATLLLDNPYGAAIVELNAMIKDN